MEKHHFMQFDFKIIVRNDCKQNEYSCVNRQAMLDKGSADNLMLEYSSKGSFPLHMFHGHETG